MARARSSKTAKQDKPAAPVYSDAQLLAGYRQRRHEYEAAGRTAHIEYRKIMQWLSKHDAG